MNSPTHQPDPLPELLQAEWSKDQVLQLFADLAAGADVQHAQLRTASADRTTTLTTAKAAFVAGEAQAVQIRYRFEGELWVDTIMPGDPTTKIIRNRLPTEDQGDQDARP